uniref:Uncharacterized protein n=1 Tax=Rhizophora mucronata TaxID=61149 RepID=A0A2P2PEE8_RHIMU
MKFCKFSDSIPIQLRREYIQPN